MAQDTEKPQPGTGAPGTVDQRGDEEESRNGEVLEGYLWHAEEVESEELIESDESSQAVEDSVEDDETDEEHLEGEQVPDDFGIVEVERHFEEKPRRCDPVESDSVTLVEEAENRRAPDVQHPTGEARKRLLEMREPEPVQPFSPM